VRTPDQHDAQGLSLLRSTRDEHLAAKYRDLTADRWDRWFFDHGNAGLAVGVALGWAGMATVGHWLVGGWIGVIIGIAVALAASTLHGFMDVFAGGAINGFGHAHTTSRTNGGHATNMPIIAWLTVGEGWHRNHHAAENSPRGTRRFGRSCRDVVIVAVPMMDALALLKKARSSSSREVRCSIVGLVGEARLRCARLRSVLPVRVRLRQRRVICQRRHRTVWRQRPVMSGSRCLQVTTITPVAARKRTSLETL
jgi:hypothetical protein